MALCDNLSTGRRPGHRFVSTAHPRGKDPDQHLPPPLSPAPLALPSTPPRAVARDITARRGAGQSLWRPACCVLLPRRRFSAELSGCWHVLCSACAPVQQPWLASLPSVVLRQSLSALLSARCKLGRVAGGRPSRQPSLPRNWLPLDGAETGRGAVLDWISLPMQHRRSRHETLMNGCD